MNTKLKLTIRGKQLLMIYALLEFVDIATMDKYNVINALQSKFKDFEDSLQNYCALRNSRIHVIVTRNIKDYKNSEIAVLSPDTFLNSFDS